MVGHVRGRIASILLGALGCTLVSGCASHKVWTRAFAPNGAAKGVLVARDPIQPGQCIAFPDPIPVSESKKEMIAWLLSGEVPDTKLLIRFTGPSGPFADVRCTGDVCRSGPLSRGSGPPRPGEKAIAYPYTCTITAPDGATKAKGDPTVMVDF